MKFMINNKKIFLGIIIGILFSGVSVYATNTYLASEVTYTPSNKNWSVDSVQSALDDLYNKQNDDYKKSDSLSFNSSNSIQTFDIGFKPNNISCIGVFSDTFANIIYNSNYNESLVVRGNASEISKTALSTWFTINDNGFTWNVTSSTWNNAKMYCTASE